jgi:hypothetical protein
MREKKIVAIAATIGGLFLVLFNHDAVGALLMCLGWWAYFEC